MRNKLHLPMTSPSRPQLALPPQPTVRRGVWALPMLLSLVFVVGVLTWLHKGEQAQREEQRKELISDALSLQSQVTSHIDKELMLLKELAKQMGRQPMSPIEFLLTPEVHHGMRQFWVSITWLDPDNRIVAHLPTSVLPATSDAPRTELSAHLRTPLSGGGALVVRYLPSDLLRQTVPWWLARKYDVRLVDGWGSVIADTATKPIDAQRQVHRISLEPTLNDGYLELIARDRITPWHQTLPAAMVAGFVLLIGTITWMLRRQVQDVSRAEAAWRTEAAWRMAMEDSLTVGLRARNLEGRVLYVNRALADMVGYAPEELVGLTPPMPYWPAESVSAAMQRAQRNMVGHTPPGGYETRWQHRKGHLLDVMLFEAALVDSRGQHIGWMGSVIDITERKRLADSERRQTDALAHHARLTMLGEVASTLAHELNQPLSAISSYNAGVMNSLKNAAPDVLRALQRVDEQAAHAGRIVQRIRQFLTRRAPQLETCALNDITQGAVNLIQGDLTRQQVQLTLVLSKNLPSVMADAVLIEQVVINLLRNACDALSAQPTNRHITAHTEWSPEERCVRLNVTDNGGGLQNRTVEALCAPFYSTKPEGMGMGLAICRSILEAHQGQLEAHEAPGGGAQFRLKLPRVLTQPLAQA
jgi:two-component system, LuxR family, sensor histidine kinase DctS